MTLKSKFAAMDRFRRQESKKRERRVSISFTERELYLLENGFGTSYILDKDDPDTVELSRIANRLGNAMAKFSGKR